MLAHEPEGDGLAVARIAANEREAAVGDAELDAPPEAVDLGRDVECSMGAAGGKD
jgi:hypothetical protein